MAEMLCSHGCQEESGNILHVDQPQPGTSTQKPRNPKIYKQGSNQGGGGAASSHGLNFHLNTATLLLFRLREIHQTDPNFEFHIWLEKAGYEKLDDIVVRYKKSGGKWTEICVQCKHATEKIDENGTKYVSNLTAEDFLTESKNRKDFSLVEYFKSFKIIEDKNDEIERFYVLHSNRPFKKPKVESKYPYFDLLEYSEQTGETILDHFFPRRYKIKYASELLNKLHSNNGEILEDERDKTIQFCDKFIYVCDDRDLEKEIREKVAKHWKNNEEQKKILEARLHHLFWEMYQNKRDPDQTFLLNEFFKSIQFNVHRVHAHFAGRFKQIEEIKDALEREEKKHMFDLLVTGMAGMGKTQLVLQYIEKNKQNYKNIIWINAESNKSIEHCFDGIAKHCHLENDIKEIYFYLRDDTLFIFDNADKVLLSKNDLNKYLYLPNDAQCTERNKFIILSQEKKWTASFIVNVDTFSEEDALEYLDGTIECSKEDKLKIAVTYQYWPLALCLAVSYIKSQPEVQLGLKSYSDIISTLQTDNTKLHKHSPEIREMESYNESLRSLWQLIRTKLESKDKLALKIVEIMSLSDPDNFPIALLKLVDICAEDVSTALLALLDSSLVTIYDSKMSIHRTLHSLIRNSVMSDTNHLENTLSLGAESFIKYLESLNKIELKKSLGNNHLVKFLFHLVESNIDMEKYINMASMLQFKLIYSVDLRNHCTSDGIFEKMVMAAEQKWGRNSLIANKALVNKALMLSQNGNYDESLDIFNKLQHFYKENLGGNPTFSIFIMNEIGTLLQSVRRYEQSLIIFDTLLKIDLEILGKNNIETLNAMHNKASVLQDMGKHKEALSIINQVNESRLEQLGPNDPDTLSSMSIKASALVSLGKYEEALRIYNSVLETRSQQLGLDHPDTIAIMNNKASVLAHLKKYEEVLRIFNQVIEASVEQLGSHHPQTLQSKSNKARVLFSMEKYEEALNICNQVLESRLEKWGPLHPDYLRSLEHKAFVLERIGKNKEALSIHNQVFAARLKEWGALHPDTIVSMNNKAVVLQSMGKKIEALIIYNQVFEARKKTLGMHNPDTIVSMQNKAKVLNTLRKLDKALSTCEQVIELREKTLEINHSDTLESLLLKASILYNMKRYEESLSICSKVIEIRTEIFGYTHPQTFEILKVKSHILKLIESIETHKKRSKFFRIISGFNLDQLDIPRRQAVTFMWKRKEVLFKFRK